jgi:hypothetical protein
MRSKSSAPQWGHRISTASLFCMTSSSKNSLHFKHLNSNIGIMDFLAVAD